MYIAIHVNKCMYIMHIQYGLNDTICVNEYGTLCTYAMHMNDTVWMSMFTLYTYTVHVKYIVHVNECVESIW